MDIEGRLAVVTGASSGLGAALAKSLIEKGALVYGLARNKEKLDFIQNQLGGNFFPVEIDISHQEEIASWIFKTFSTSHAPTILINNAGAGYFTKFDELSLEHWHEMINTNLNGNFYITSKIVTFMKQADNFSHIINIGSILGKTTRSEGAAYSATKYAMQGLSESLFKELRRYKIKVTCVNPGSIDTDFFKESGIQAHHNMLLSNDIAKFIMQILETPDNFLVDEITLRPLNPKTPE